MEIVSTTLSSSPNPTYLMKSIHTFICDFSISNPTSQLILQTTIQQYTEGLAPNIIFEDYWRNQSTIGSYAEDAAMQITANLLQLEIRIWFTLDQSMYIQKSFLPICNSNHHQLYLLLENFHFTVLNPINHISTITANKSKLTTRQLEQQSQLTPINSNNNRNHLT